MERMIAYLVEFLEEDPFKQPPFVLDLGTGNGHLLFSLLDARDELGDEALEPARLCGVDYSPASIKLAQAIGATRGEGCEAAVFEEADLRDPATVLTLKQGGNDGLGWDIVCDKGTVRIQSNAVRRCMSLL